MILLKLTAPHLLGLLLALELVSPSEATATVSNEFAQFLLRVKRFCAASIRPDVNISENMTSTIHTVETRRRPYQTTEGKVSLQDEPQCHGAACPDPQDFVWRAALLRAKNSLL